VVFVVLRSDRERSVLRAILEEGEGEGKGSGALLSEAVCSLPLVVCSSFIDVYVCVRVFDLRAAPLIVFYRS